jgi:hypothetical protein
LHAADALEGDGLVMGYKIIFQSISFDAVTSNAPESTAVVTTIGQIGYPPETPIPPTPGGGTIVVRFGDPNFDNDTLTYTNALLAGLTGYVIWSSGLDGYFKTAQDVDIHYNGPAGSFTILVPGFKFNVGDELIIWPTLLTPPTS